jgi:hypothetical protein
MSQAPVVQLAGVAPNPNAMHAEWLDRAAAGVDFILHRKGKNVTLRQFSINTAQLEVNYVAGSVEIIDVVDIVKGKGTGAFMADEDLVPTACCFSIICKRSTVDIQANSEAERDEWCSAFSCFHVLDIVWI